MLIHCTCDRFGAPRLCTLRTIGSHGIKTWRAFGALSHLLFFYAKLQLVYDATPSGFEFVCQRTSVRCLWNADWLVSSVND